jgi:hypothetical protein
MQTINERTNHRYQVTLKDHAGQPVTLASLTALTLTLYDVVTGGVINSRENQNIKNANGGTFGAGDGLLTMDFVAADTPIVNPALLFERHRARFDAVWNGGEAHWEEDIVVHNLGKLP